jgi:hypothetical protein
MKVVVIMRRPMACEGHGTDQSSALEREKRKKAIPLTMVFYMEANQGFKVLLLILRNIGSPVESLG